MTCLSSRHLSDAEEDAPAINRNLPERSQNIYDTNERIQKYFQIKRGTRENWISTFYWNFQEHDVDVVN